MVDSYYAVRLSCTLIVCLRINWNVLKWLLVMFTLYFVNGNSRLNVHSEIGSRHNINRIHCMHSN